MVRDSGARTLLLFRKLAPPRFAGQERIRVNASWKKDKATLTSSASCFGVVTRVSNAYRTMPCNYKLAGALALAGLASTQAFAPGPAIGGLGHRSAGLALARQAPRPALRTAGGLRMESKVTAQEVDGQVEFMGVDAAGNMVKLNLGAKEKLYLDATSAFFNDNEKIMDDEDYDQLKNDLAFEGSNVGLMSRDEVKFMVSHDFLALSTFVFHQFCC